MTLKKENKRKMDMLRKVKEKEVFDKLKSDLELFKSEKLKR